MSPSIATSRGDSGRWSGLRGVCAAVAALAFFGSVALAPLSVPVAFAAEARGGSLGAFGEIEGASEGQRSSQVFTAARVGELPVDVVASPLELVPTSSAAAPAEGALYSLQQFLFRGVVNWGGYKFTFYSQQVLPGPGLQIPGRHVNEGGYVSDGDGYIVLAGSAPKGTVYETPFGYPGKIYDRGTVGNHLDVYIR